MIQLILGKSMSTRSTAKQRQVSTTPLATPNVDTWRTHDDPAVFQASKMSEMSIGNPNTPKTAISVPPQTINKQKSLFKMTNDTKA